MGKPDDEVTKEHYQWAIENGAKQDYIENFSDGYTGIVATLDYWNRKGPQSPIDLIWMRSIFMNPSWIAHSPKQEGFGSKLPHKMHACGHDAHTAIGLGLGNSRLLAIKKH